MNDELIDINELVIRYLDNSASLEDKRILLLWLNESDKNLADFNEIRELWLSCDVALDDEREVDIALKRLQCRILNATPTSIKQPKRIFRWSQWAAVFLVLLGMGYWLSTQSLMFKGHEISIQNQLITAKGSKGQFLLPDGTVVWLNGGSKLVYPERFDEDKRLVKLEGEGYFEVVKNKEKPFVVKSGDLDVEVLGTSFDVSCYPFQDNIDVVLLSGSVKIKGGAFKDDVLLKPNMKLEYQKNSQTVKVFETEAHLYADWIKERLVFDNDKLSDIIISLEGWYNISIECPRSFAEKTRMTFTVRGENIEEIFKAMSLIAPIRYSILDHKVTITPK